MTFLETLFPIIQPVAVTRAYVHEERSSAEREIVVVVILVLETWVQVHRFFTFLMDLSKPLAFPYSTSPKWRRTPVLGRVFSGVKASRTGLGYPGLMELSTLCCLGFAHGFLVCFLAGQKMTFSL